MSITRAQELRKQAAEKFEEAKKVADAAEKEGRTMNAEESAKFDSIMGDGTPEVRGTYDALIDEAERLERMVDAEKRADYARKEREEAEGRDRTENSDSPRSADPVIDSPEYRDAFWRNLRGARLDDEERELLSRGEVGDTREAQELRAMTGASVAAGGFALPGATLGRLIEAEKFFGSVQAFGATTITTDDGNDITFPMINETDVYGEQLGEGQTATDLDPSSGKQKTLKAYPFSSKVIEVPLRLMADAGFDLEGWVVGHSAERIGRIRNQKHTIGGGNSTPEGIATAAVVGKQGATGNSTTIKNGDDLIDVQESLDPAYRNGAMWMLRQSALKEVRKLKDGQGRWIFEPSLPARTPATILGDGFVLNAEMPAMAASAKSILYGAGRFYYIRTVNQRYFFRLVEAGAKRLAVEFIAWELGDGALLNAGTNPVVAWQNSAS